VTEEVVERLRGRKRLRSRLRKKWEKMGMRGGGEKNEKQQNIRHPNSTT